MGIEVVDGGGGGGSRNTMLARCIYARVNSVVVCSCVCVCVSSAAATVAHNASRVCDCGRAGKVSYSMLNVCALCASAAAARSISYHSVTMRVCVTVTPIHSFDLLIRVLVCVCECVCQ